LRYLIFLLTIIPVYSWGQKLAPDKLKQWLEAREKGEMHFLLVDVRTEEEHEMGFIPGTDTLIPLDEIKKGGRPAVDPETDTVVVYCRTGRRSKTAQKILKKSGFKWVFNGMGIKQWQKKGFELVKDEVSFVPPSKVCMTNDRVYNSPQIPVEINGKTYYGCCMGCVEALKKYPEKYCFATDPVSGEKVDKSKAFIYDYNGKALYFKSKENLAEFVKNPDQFLP
jgi:rhodanese-related sulfurtransferase/YHS domain-containing protein